ncbi:MAG TPA: gluconate 2-dehydrogenase subunit 3 family protein [Anaeromyxobacteraceae bacterium]|nr:gluconate 2-dehydrogenase subunit 3 family protein [Anaeromyxobacteraceae bacterium]
MARRQRYQRVLLPGEAEGRRDFLRKGLVGGLLLAAGGGAFLATRRTRAAAGLGPLQVLTPEEATVVLAVANRLVPERVGFPRPLEVGVPRKVDAVVAGLHPGTQKEIRRLLNLFEGAVAGFLFEGQTRTFTTCSPWEQDDRLRGWAHSRVTLRRSGFRALKKLVTAAYYASPETWPALGYPGPPLSPPPVPAERPPVPEGNEEEAAAPKPPAPAAEPPGQAVAAPRRSEPAPRPPLEAAPRPPEALPAPRQVEPVPTPRGGIPPPEEALKP